jgi:hypothetical protein
MIELFNNKQLRKELALNGLKRSEVYHWNLSAEKIWGALNKLIVNNY